MCYYTVKFQEKKLCFCLLLAASNRKKKKRRERHSPEPVFGLSILGYCRFIGMYNGRSHGGGPASSAL